MTANEQHQLMVKAAREEAGLAMALLQEALHLFETTTPPRRDSAGPDISRLNLRIYGQLSQARENAKALLDMVQRQRS